MTWAFHNRWIAIQTWGPQEPLDPAFAAPMESEHNGMDGAFLQNTPLTNGRDRVKIFLLE